MKKTTYIRHGDKHSRLYGTWCNMKQRCYDENHPDFKKYGAKGVTVCDEWQEYPPFREWAMANGYDPTAKRGEYTIDRIDNAKGYSPDNCRWADYIVQNNNRSNTLMLTMNGETKPVCDWARQYGIKSKTIKARIYNYHWSVEDAITKGVRNGRK